MARLLPVVALVPAFGGKRLPVPVRLGLTIVLAAGLVPTSFPDEQFPELPGLLIWFGLLLKELAVGAVLALSATCLFEALHIGGQLTDHFRGASQSTARTLHDDSNTTPLGEFHLLLACLLFFDFGGPGLFLQTLQESLVQIPLQCFPDASNLDGAVSLVLGMSATAITTGLTIALPAGAALLCVDVVLGFANRAAPQIQVFFLGMPLKALLGVMALAVSLDIAMDHFLALLQ